MWAVRLSTAKGGEEKATTKTQSTEEYNMSRHLLRERNTERGGGGKREILRERKRYREGEGGKEREREKDRTKN